MRLVPLTEAELAKLRAIAQMAAAGEPEALAEFQQLFNPEQVMDLIASAEMWSAYSGRCQPLIPTQTSR